VIVFVLLFAQSAADPGVVGAGERIFAQNCSVGYCHGIAGSAGRGPRLRGRNFEESYLLRVTRDGIPRSAMPAWKGRLSDQEILAVVKYVASLSDAARSVTVGALPSESISAATAQAPTAQVQRGAALFFNAAKDAYCGACHALDGRGTAVGPDLTKVANRTPREIAAATRKRRPEHVVTAHMKDGDSFPALAVLQESGSVKLLDLTTFPPVLRTLEPAEIESIASRAEWTHDPFLKGIGPEQMADLVTYIRWIALGDSRPVSGEELK
jgi:mono/diheme cytochrome c family protein